MELKAKKMGSVACLALLKTLFFAFNLLLITIGLGLLLIGVYGLNSFKDILTLSTYVPSTSIYIAIICLGLFILVIGILSLWCTINNITWLLYIYSVLVFALFLSVFSVSILFIVKYDSFEDSIKVAFDSAVKKYPSDSQATDMLQSTLKCCGSNNYTDWFSTTWAKNTHSVPKSCCINKNSCKNEDLDIAKVNKDIYEQGCFKKASALIENNYAIIGGVIFACSLIILGGSLLTCSLTHKIKKQRYEQME